MTLFQARFVQWLTFKGYSLRMTAVLYYSRYNIDGTQKNKEDDYGFFCGNQIDGIFLRVAAIKCLKEHGREIGFTWKGI